MTQQPPPPSSSPFGNSSATSSTPQNPSSSHANPSSGTASAQPLQQKQQLPDWGRRLKLTAASVALGGVITYVASPTFRRTVNSNTEHAIGTAVNAIADPIITESFTPFAPRPKDTHLQDQYLARYGGPSTSDSYITLATKADYTNNQKLKDYLHSLLNEYIITNGTRLIRVWGDVQGAHSNDDETETHYGRDGLAWVEITGVDKRELDDRESELVKLGVSSSPPKAYPDPIRTPDTDKILLPKDVKPPRDVP